MATSHPHGSCFLWIVILTLWVRCSDHLSILLTWKLRLRGGRYYVQGRRRRQDLNWGPCPYPLHSVTAPGQTENLTDAASVLCFRTRLWEECVGGSTGIYRPVLSSKSWKPLPSELSVTTINQAVDGWERNARIRSISKSQLSQRLPLWPRATHVYSLSLSFLTYKWRVSIS